MTTYTLFSQAATGSSLTADPTAYTMGVQFSVGVSGATLTGIWFYSASGAGVLPQTIGLYAVSGASLVHSESASWSGAAGSGWVRAAFSSPPSLTASTSYKAAVAQNTSANWYSTTASYWSSGAGSGGITNGPLTGVNNAGGDGGQDTFTTSVPAYPASSFNASNYWVDPEVTTTSSGTNGTVPAHLVAARRGPARAVWRGCVSATVNGVPVPPPPWTATSDFIPGLARPGFATPGNPLTPATGPAAPIGLPAARVAGQSAYLRETYRFTRQGALWCTAARESG